MKSGTKKIEELQLTNNTEEIMASLLKAKHRHVNVNSFDSINFRKPSSSS